MALAFLYTEQHPLESEADYPYTASGSHLKCKYDEAKAVFGAKSFKEVLPLNPISLMNAINKQPVSVAIEADQPIFRQYTGGVITDAQACGDKLNHGVLAVGYGMYDKQKFFLVKNSWSAKWGDQGYVRIGFDEGLLGVGVCGIQMQPVVPSVEAPQPEPSF